MQKNKRLDFLFVVLIYICVSCIPFSRFISKNWILFLIQILCGLGLVIFEIFYVTKRTSLDTKKEKINIKNSLLLLPVLLVCFSNFFFRIFSGYSLKVSINIDVILYIVLMLFVAINEEIIFRLLFLNNIDEQPPLKAIVISASIFALCHLTSFLSTFNPADLLVVVYTFFLGLLLGFSYLFTRSIYPCIIIHFLFNLFNDVLYGYFEISMRYILISGAFVIAVGIYTILLFYFWNKKLK